MTQLQGCETKLGGNGTQRSMRIHDYRDLIVWQKSVDLTELVYQIVQRFPAHERYGLSAQATRAAISVASNIADGNAFQHRSQYIYYLDVARGSLYELATQLEIATRLTYISLADSPDAFSKIDSISRMLLRLRTRLRATAPSQATRPVPRSPRAKPASPRPPPAAASLTPGIAP
ncbi:MAG TPA: four helix bundle protein [Gemmatimonadaceae bacterium]|nr:four helix bundle protein [Gemmatimonadaceae bacterium]